MARAAFIMDRMMAYVGLSGRSFIPLLSSFACAIPGHHGDARDRRSQGPADHDPDRAADDLFGAVAGLCGDHRRIHSGQHHRSRHRAAGAGAVRALRRRHRGRHGGRAGAAPDRDQGQRLGIHHGTAQVPVAAAARSRDRAVAARLGVPAPRRHDHLHGHRRAVAAAQLPEGRAGRKPVRSQHRRPHRQRARGRGRADRLQSRDRARADPGDGRARGGGRLAGDDLRDRRRR